MKKKLLSLLIIMTMVLSLSVIPTDEAAASSSTYWLKVNRTANVVNVYKNVKGEWKPYKAMLCSCGKNTSGSRTPSGNYTVKKKWRWQQLFHGVSGQYVSQFYGNYLFHSVVYKTKGKNKTCLRKEYNKLGKNASHGCVRLATMDAKWIYYHCPKGTKVTVYSSTTPGPFGKPSKVSMKGSSKLFWDPTDPISSNKYFGMKGPVISIDKEKTVEYGASFKILKGVSAQSPYTFEKLTSSVKVHGVTYCAPGESEYKTVASKTVDTTVPGTYKIKYKCYNKYCGRKTVYKTFKLTVNPEEQPNVEQPDIEQPGEQPEETVTNMETEPVNPAESGSVTEIEPEGNTPEGNL